MALIKCSECGKEISDKASTCPICGNPMQPVYISGKVETERTNKKWKKKFLWGMAFYLIGWAMLYKFTAVGILLMLTGVITVFIAAIGRWWNNG